MFGGSANQLPLANCTFSGNTATLTGGGLYLSSQSGGMIRNCVFWGDTAPAGREIYLYLEPDLSTIAYCDIEGGQQGIELPDTLIWGDGNIDADPVFVDTDNGDYRLSGGSPCIDAGDNTAVPVGIEVDLDGNPRFADDPATPDGGNSDGINPIVDIGAYEFPASECLDEDGDGRVTICHSSQGNGNNPRTMSVPESAVAAHLAHGDDCGPCP